KAWPLAISSGRRETDWYAQRICTFLAWSARRLSHSLTSFMAWMYWPRKKGEGLLAARTRGAVPLGSETAETGTPLATGADGKSISDVAVGGDSSLVDKQLERLQAHAEAAGPLHAQVEVRWRERRMR
ncbi:hypothetical protein BCR44DRAFT_1423753, partial [Catenaria anguillulae PL171]